MVTITKEYESFQVDTHAYRKEDEIAEWLDNTGVTLGILKFAYRFLPEFRRCKTPWYHDDILREILFAYAVAEIDERGKVIKELHTNKFDRYLGIVAFRGSAKTTLTTVLLPLYNICFKGMPSILRYKDKLYKLVIGEDLILITSKTSYVAEQRVLNIRNQITGTNQLTEYFGDMKPSYVRNEKNTAWTQNLFCTKNGTYIWGLGAGQQIRGSNIDSFRPTLIIFDDMYSIDNTRTDIMRNKIDEWFYTEALDSIDDLNGKAVFIGTIVHEDTVPKKIKAASEEKNPLWRYIEIPAIDPSEFENMLKRVEYDKFSNKFLMPEDQLIKQWQRDCTTLAWPDRIDLKYMFNLYRMNIQGRSLDYMYQEYLNVIQAPENRQFTEEMMRREQCLYKRVHNENFIGIKNEAGDHEWFNANIYFGIDLASADSIKSDDTVILILCALSNGWRVVLRYENGKMGQRDEVFNKDNSESFMRERNNIKKRGVVDETLRLAAAYHPTMVAVEVVSEQLKTFQEIRRVAVVNNFPIRLYPYTPRGDKLERITDSLIGYYQTGCIIHNFPPPMTELENQLARIGKVAHDDVADALSIAMSVARTPTPIQMPKSGEFIQQQERIIRDWRLL